MYDYLKEIPLSYREEYNNLVVNNNVIHHEARYQLVILSYKEENCIGDCLDSLINQTISPNEFEVLIINNCSFEEEFDNTEDIVKEKLEKYKYDNIHLINVKFPKEIASAALAAKYGMDYALYRWNDYVNFNDGIVAFFGADNIFENHYIEEVIKTFKIPSKYENPHQLNPIGEGEDRLDILVTNCDNNNFSSFDGVIDILELKPYINKIESMNDLLGKWYYNNFDINWGIKKNKKVNLDDNLLYREDDGNPIWPKTFRAKTYNDLGGVELQSQEEQAIIIKAVLNNCVIKYNDMTNFTHVHRLETPRVPDGSFTQLLVDSFDAYTNKKDLQVHKIDYWTMRNNIEKWFYESKFYDNWKPTFFVEGDLQKIKKDSGESYLYFKNKFIHQFKDDINKIYEKTNINKVINEIKKEL
tara:strand:+ start:1751 stop:2992 length:1242 start_codon:yes stop_codon:yes gene_type:complete